MNARETGSVTKIALGDREWERAPVTLPCSLAPNGHLAEQMSKTSERISAADIHDPFREDRSIRDTVAPECFGNARVACSQTTKVNMRQAQDRRARKGGQAPPGLGAHHRWQVGHVARNVKAGDLSSAVTILTEAADQASNDETGVINLLTLPDKVNVCRDHLHLPLQGKESVLLFFNQD
jgi:hypothetical protein